MHPNPFRDEVCGKTGFKTCQNRTRDLNHLKISVKRLIVRSSMMNRKVKIIHNIFFEKFLQNVGSLFEFFGQGSKSVLLALYRKRTQSPRRIPGRYTDQLNYLLCFENSGFNKYEKAHYYK